MSHAIPVSRMELADKPFNRSVRDADSPFVEEWASSILNALHGQRAHGNDLISASSAARMT